MNSSDYNRGDDIDRQEQQIDRTLAALGQTQPAPDFHARLLSALDQPSGTSTSVVLSPSARRPAGFWRWRGYGILATALAASLAWLLLLPHTVVHHVSPRSQSARPASLADSSANLPLQPRGSLARAPIPASGARGQVSASHPAATLELSATAPPGLDQQALADFQAPSHPAPPLPPTSQERLVRLMLRRGEKHELALLNPDEEAAFAQQERSSFSNFFDPPPSPALAKAFREANYPGESNRPSVEPAPPAQPNALSNTSGDPQ